MYVCIELICSLQTLLKYYKRQGWAQVELYTVAIQYNKNVTIIYSKFMGLQDSQNLAKTGTFNGL